MKKRLLSLALCLALCLGLFPFGVLATDGGGVYVPPGSSTEGGGGVYEAAAETAAASLTIGDVTSYYQTLDDTVAAANEAGGEQVIKLYQDYDGKYATGNKPIVLNNGTITLNLNGHALKKICLTAQESRVEITGNGSVSQVLASGQNGKLVINSETVTVTAFTYAQNGGRLELSAGTYNGALAVYADSSASLSGGTYQRIYGTRLAGVAPKDLLADGKGYKFTSSQRWVSYMYLKTGQDSLDNVTVTNAPIENMTLTASNTTITYGDTLTLTATTTKANGVDDGKIISYQWYNGTEEMSGENNPSYTLSNLSAGNYTFRCVATCDNYPLIKDISITVTPVDLNNATVKIASLTYNGSGQSPKVEVKLGDQILNASTDYTVDVTPQIDAGTYTLTITGAGNYTGTLERTWSITPIYIRNAAVISSLSKVYDGSAAIELAENQIGFYKSNSADPTIEVPSSAYTISEARLVSKAPDGEYVDSPEAGEKYGIAFTVTLNDTKNYKWESDESIVTKEYTQSGIPSGDGTFTITKADVPAVTPGKLTVVNNHEGTYTYDLKQLLPTAPNGTYGNIDWNGGYQHSFSSQFSYVKNYTIDNDGILTIISHDNNLTTTGKVGTITITVITDNYENISLPIEVFAENKIPPELDGSVSLSKTAITFGESLDNITISGTMKDGDTTVEGTFSWAASKELYPAGTHEVEWIFTPTNSGKYAVATGKVTITVNKATPTGKPEYTAITTSGKKLSDASLTQTETSFSVPGTVAWKLPADTEVTANTAYEWVFTPNDTDNYNSLTGTITLWHKSSSGSSSGSVTPGTKTDTVKNPDGSTTKTETKADGSKTETTTASSGGGSTGTTVTKTDAKGNTTTEASAKLSDRDVKEAQEKGEAVTVPVKGIAAAKDANAATKIKIDVPNNANKTTVEIPVENVTSGTVAVIVHEDGTEELVKDSKPTEHGVQLELSGSTTVKIIDNSKTFDDTKGHWSQDDVNFVAARELFNGVGGNQFGVSQPMTRGMVNTVLARLAGVDTTPGQGQAWYEVGTDWAKKNGISDGTNPTAPVTREQLATLLYRYAGSPSVSGTLHAADAASVSDYAEDALLWANQNGIVNGVGSNTIAPKDNAQRAQVAAMLARYLQNQ